jgi:hypothetical protein
LKTSADITEELVVPDASEKSHYSALYVKMFSEFFDAVDKKKQNVQWIDEAYQSVYLLNECLRSSELYDVKS